MKIVGKILILVAALSLAACGGSDDKEDIPVVPTTVSVSTPEASDVTETSFTVTATITTNGQTLTSCGFCYGTSANPDVSGDKVYCTVGSQISASLNSLAPGTTYYVRAYALCSSEVTYSSQATVTTTATYDPTPAEVKAYTGPTYADYYVDIAGWDQRSKWNLSNVHDPTVMLADDGYYYMYQTDASYGNAHDGHGHFHGRRSKDLVNWEYLGATMADAPAWVKEMLNDYRAEMGVDPIDNPTYGFWAPTARNLGNGTYRMYYSIVIDMAIVDGCNWGERAFIGLMETTDPASNQWEDKGYVVCSSSDQGLDWSGALWEGAYFRYNAIDPTYIVTPEGEHWLIYGSWHSGFAALQLDPSTGKPVNELTKPWGTLDDIACYGQRVATRLMSSRWQGSEGPEVVYHDGYYYLFMAYDALAIPYNTRVVRSTSITGPYVGIDGTDVTTFGGEAYPIMTHPYKFNGDYGWVGISHCAVFDDGQGNWYYASQGRLPENVYNNASSNAIMLGHVRSIRWTKEGWPLVMPERYGAVPQVAITEDEIPGTWEHIDLSYVYGQQQESSLMVLASDHTITSGTWKGGTWSFDSANQILTANGVELYLQRECNWESASRPATIVYAGFGNGGKKTYWGKKSN